MTTGNPSIPSFDLAGKRALITGGSRGIGLAAAEALAARNLDGVAEPARYVTLARFFAENVAVQAGALERNVVDAAAGLQGADAVLTA